tara:strand:+ start:1616 stop:1999 length:384 start_codon:yes stop_codon:yes gene_type:complete
MKKRESLLWAKIRKLKLIGQIFRIESNTINGIPDVYYIREGKSIWVELKSNEVKNLGLSKYQINWHIDHQIHGGKSFILQETLSQGLLKLYKVRETRRVELLAEGEVSSATLLLLFDRMFWEKKSKS